MNIFKFSHFALKQWKKLDKNTQTNLLKKLESLKKHPHIFRIIEPLTNFFPATHKLRSGNYRFILKHETKKEFLVLDIRHRREIYK